MSIRPIVALIGLGIIVSFSTCNESDHLPSQPPPTLSEMDNTVAVKWADLTLYTMRFSAFNSPTYSSRSLGYLGLAMYESIVPGDPTHQSLQGQLTGLVLPLPEVDQDYHWGVSLNAAQHTLLKLLYPVPGNSHRFIHTKIDSLADAVDEELANEINSTVVTRSKQFGIEIANAIYNWSREDGGHEGYARNFDSTFPFPTGESYWIPPTRGQTISQYPLHPHWGENRRFVPANANRPVPSIEPFSTDPTSNYYQMYEAIYEKDKILTLEEREIAAWWSDDPTETFSPPGHSYFVATLAIKGENTKLMKAAETYARVGLAVADAFINCWKIKYTYFNERPSSYIKKYIDSQFRQFWPEPPFPAFPSGHAMHAAAAAVVLTDLYGPTFGFVDSSNEGKRRYDDLRFFDLTYPARTFESFWDAAIECAYSRFLGGIHTQQDNDVAQEEGTSVGEAVNALQWSK